VAIALKNIFISSSSMNEQQTRDAFRKECQVLSLLDHPHVLRLFGAVEEEDNICIVTELVPGGSLFDLTHTKPHTHQTFTKPRGCYCHRTWSV